MSRDERPVSRGAKILAIALALLPPARMTWIVFTNGENNLSNDYGMRVPLVASMLDGTCSLEQYIHEAWVAGGHSLIALIPIYYLNARFFAWSVWVELGLGLALVAATLPLLARAAPDGTRWLLLPLFSLLLFSTSRVTVFTFGEPALQYGLSQLGVAIGVYALVKWRERPIVLATALAFGGVLASWSWGGGIMTWPVFAVALFLLRVRTFAAWAIFFSGAAVGLAQYVWLLFFCGPDSTALRVASTQKIRTFLDLLRRPFINGIAGEYSLPLTYQILGLASLAMLAILAVRRRGLAQRAPALVLIGWSLLVAAQIATFRSGPAPWYVHPIALFWVGLAMLLALESIPVRVGAITVIASLALIVQFTWEDKSLYLLSRSPASAACLREWRTAPAGCGARLFQWKGGAPPYWLGEPLEHRHLSVFGSRRTYLLQGDVAVGLVAFEAPNERAFLSRDDRTPADPNDFHRLNLVLTPGASVTWRVDLPPGMHRATFSTVVRASPGDKQLGRGARVSVTAESSPIALEERTFLSRETARPLSIDLSSLAGKRITLRLVAEETQTGMLPLVFEAPRVFMTLDPEQNPHAP